MKKRTIRNVSLIVVALLLVGLIVGSVITSLSYFDRDSSGGSSDKSKENSSISSEESSVISDETSEPLSSETSIESSEEISKEISFDVTEEPSEESSEEPPIEFPVEPEIAEIYSLIELRDFLNQSKNDDVLNVEFKYHGNEMFDAQLVARMVNAFYISYSYVGGHYELEITEFPGDRIVDKYNRVNDVSLTPDEQKVLLKAGSIVSEAREKCSSEYELELYLHDYLAENITYYSPSVDVPDKNNPPRHLTCVGAILDGKANCQGYTDAFYLLASMAGFEVSRLSVVDKSGGGHMLNTINLNGDWYIVDVTFDDTLYNTGDETNYRLFNAAEDVCNEYSWSPEMEYNDVAETTDGYYYYYGEKTFDSLEEMAYYITECYIAGETEFQIMLKGYGIGWKELDTTLHSCLNNSGVSFSYTIWSYNTGVNTYFTVKFN